MNLFPGSSMHQPGNIQISRGTCSVYVNTFITTFRIELDGSLDKFSPHSSARTAFLMIFLIFFIISKCHSKSKKKILKDDRYFIRKHKINRKRNQKTNFHVIVFILYINKNEKYCEISSSNKDFFTMELLRFSSSTFDLNVNYMSIYFFNMSNSSFSRKKGNYLRLILLLSGDVETHPGPAYYQIHNPELCGYYRTAIFSVVTGINLSKDINEDLSIDENLVELKKIFGNHFNIHELEGQKLKKMKSKILQYNADWGKNRHRNNKKDYYEYFATKNWLNLSDKIKRRHTLCCKKCPVSCYDSFSKYPSVYEKHENDIKIITKLAEDLLKHKKSPKLLVQW